MANWGLCYLTAGLCVNSQRDTIAERKQHVDRDAMLREQRAEDTTRDTEDAVESRAGSNAVILIWENHST